MVMKTFARLKKKGIVFWHRSHALLISSNTEPLWDAWNPVGWLMWQQLFVKSFSSGLFNGEKWLHERELTEIDHANTSKCNPPCLWGCDLMIKSNKVLFTKCLLD